MRYSFISAAILALTSSVFAQTEGFDPISIPTQDQQVAVGSSLDITWQPSTVYTGPITIQLLQGATPSTLELGDVISAGVDQTLGKFTWVVPSTLQSFATYGFKITLDSTATSASPVFQFSFPFHITGLGASSSSSSASVTGGTTTVHLSTATGYVASSTSAASVNSTSTYVASTYSAKPTTYSAAQSSVYASSNLTLYTTVKPTASASASATGSSSNSTATTPATATANAAVNNLARGGFAVLGGLVLALAL